MTNPEPEEQLPDEILDQITESKQNPEAGTPWPPEDELPVLMMLPENREDYPTTEAWYEAAVPVDKDRVARFFEAHPEVLESIRNPDAVRWTRPPIRG